MLIYFLKIDKRDRFDNRPGQLLSSAVYTLYTDIPEMRDGVL